MLNQNVAFTILLYIYQSDDTSNQTIIYARALYFKFILEVSINKTEQLWIHPCVPKAVVSLRTGGSVHRRPLRFSSSLPVFFHPIQKASQLTRKKSRKICFLTGILLQVVQAYVLDLLEWWEGRGCFFMWTHRAGIVTRRYIRGRRTGVGHNQG